MSEENNQKRRQRVHAAAVHFLGVVHFLFPGSCSHNSFVDQCFSFLVMDKLRCSKERQCSKVWDLFLEVPPLPPILHKAVHFVGSRMVLALLQLRRHPVVPPD